MFQSWLYWQALALALPVYWWLPVARRPGALALASMAVVALLDLPSALILTLWSGLFYGLTPYAVRIKAGANWPLRGLILGVVTLLVFFKYLPPWLATYWGPEPWAGMLVPLGASYYTFKLIHYVVERVRGEIQEHSWSRFLCYLFLLPIFSAGPIERYDSFWEQHSPRWQRSLAITGLTRIAHGLIKQFWVVQLLLPDVLRKGDIDPRLPVAQLLPELSAGQVWLLLAGTYAAIYLSFSAYSDLAIGCARLFGFHIQENFHWPVLARNLSDFWRRWHISLSRWCHSYVYMPVFAYSRKPVAALFATFLIIGLWHAATPSRVAWGLCHGLGVYGVSLWGRQQRRHPALARWQQGAFARALAWLLTQGFVVLSMAFLLDESRQGLDLALAVLAKLLGWA